MKKIVLLVLSLLMLMQVNVFAAFTDVQSGHWAEYYINALTKQGIINGYPDETFKPDNTLTRAEYLKLIMTGTYVYKDFSKVEKKFNHWVGEYVNYAEKVGILEEGEYTIDNVDLPITRIEMIRILDKTEKIIQSNGVSFYIEDANGNGLTANPNRALSFSDIDSLSNEEKESLLNAVSNGYINGYPDGTFKPNNNLTRAEATKILSLFFNII